MSFHPARDLERLESRLELMGEMLRWPEDRLYLRVESISAWSPAQHLDHVMKSLDLFLDRVQRLETGEDPEILPAGQPIWQGRVCLVTRWIPRGRAEAPDPVLPDPRPPRPGLIEIRRILSDQVRDLRPRAGRLTALRGVLPHHALGAFDACQWIRFADVHTRHHLAIAADVDRHRAIGVPKIVVRLDDEPEYGVHPEAP